MGYFHEAFTKPLKAHIVAFFLMQKMDTIERMLCLNKTKDCLDLFEKKSFETLPHVKNLAGKITLVEGMRKYQDIPYQISIMYLNISKRTLSLEKYKYVFTVDLKKRMIASSYSHT